MTRNSPTAMAVIGIMTQKKQSKEDRNTAKDDKDQEDDS